MALKREESDSAQEDRVSKRTRQSVKLDPATIITTSIKTIKASARQRHRNPTCAYLARPAILEGPTKAGEVYVFGTNNTGQLGLDMARYDERKRPMPLEALRKEDIVDVACGGMHSVALSQQGKIWSWGCNDHFALGRDGEEDAPALVDNLDNVKIVKTVCSDSLTMALSDDGQLYCWGTFRCEDGVLGFSPTQYIQQKPAIFQPLKELVIVDIAAGADHCLALAKGGRVLVWGNSQQFQLGRYVPSRFLKNGLRPEFLRLKNTIKSIGCGAHHSFAVAEDNTLYAWGLNNYQQCGIDNSNNGDEVFIKKPRIVESIKGKGKIKSVDGGNHHSVVLMEDGTVYSFGRADSCQLGLTHETIERLEVRERQEEEAINRHDGNTHSVFKAVGIPTKIEQMEGIQDIAVGSNHAIALNASGSAYSWGFGLCYALGNGSDEDEPVPSKITGQKLEGHTVLRIAAGAQHSVLLASSS